MARVIGPDVSFYEDDPQTPKGIDYVKMRKVAGYVIIRAGQNLWPDRIFKTTWKDAKAVGIPRGSYWFFDSRADPKQQAELYFSLHEGDLGELPLFADFEESYNGPYKGWRKWIDFLERLKQLAGGKEIGVYTAFYYWRDNAPNEIARPNEFKYFHQYPLWIAHYGAVVPSVPKPWLPNEWLFWQYSEAGDGQFYGAESKGIDLNYFNGDTKKLLARFNLPPIDGTPGEVSSDPVTIDQTGIKYKVNTTALNMREGPDAAYAKVGDLTQNEIVDAIVALPDLSWIKVVRKDGLTGWCAGKYLLKVSGPPPLPDTIDQTGIQYKVNTPLLDLLSGPGPTYNKIGSLNQGQVVDALIATKDLSWIKVNSKSDSLIGWGAGQYLVKVTPPPPDTIDQTGIQYKVNASVVDILDGPGTTYNKIGSLNQDEVVDALIATKDLSWIKINRKSDNITGWVAGQYLVKVVTPPPPPPDTVDQTGIKYRVIATVLNVREGPGTNYNVIGTFNQGEVVDALVATTDLSWIKNRRSSDGLTGWSSAQYLVKVDPTPPPQLGPWLQVIATALNVREGPGTNYKSLGTLQQNEVVQGLASSPDNNWTQITRVDGFAGWCANQYLKKLGDTPPASFIQKLFNGVTYTRKTYATPRTMIVHALGVDMYTVGLQFLVTPPVRQDGKPPLCTRTTSQFMSQFGVQIAINGDGFYYQDPATYPPKDYCPDGGDPLWPNGFAVSRGTIYSNKKPGQPILYISKSNKISFNTFSGALYNALSGDRILVDKGKAISSLDQNLIDPRTAVGINSNGRWLILVCVDGRETSAGATFVDLANIMISLGAYTAMSLDGGGSSTMVVEGYDKKPYVLNTPVDDNIAGKERAVANHLGIFIKT